MPISRLLILAALVAMPMTAESQNKTEFLRVIDETAAKGPFSPSWESLERQKVPKWYLDAKFGIFIHWGLYSVPAFGSEWYPRQMYLKDSAEFKHHVATYGSQSKFGYKDFIAKFKAEHFDANAWAKLFKEAGAKFVVPVAEHHDGFPMYDCGFTAWSAAKMGPKRDLIGDLATAIRNQGMVLGLSSHRAEHWWFLNGGRKFDSDVNDPKFADFYGPAMPDGTQPDQAYLDDWLARTCELVDKYHPQLVWFDWWIEQPVFKPYLQKFGAFYYNRGEEWGRGVAINYKNSAFPAKAAVLDVERGQLASIRPFYWQTDTAVQKNSWGYTEHQDYKTAGSIIGDLVDIVSKNGALLLNIGPKSDGTIPVPEQQILREIGKWLAVNGEAIYGTRPWLKFGEGPTQVVGGSFNDTKRQAFTGEDIRFTRKGGNLYAIALAWPGRQFTIKSLAVGSPLVDGEIREVKLLGHRGRLEFTRTAEGMVVQLPAEKPCDHAYAFRITGVRPHQSAMRSASAGSLVLEAEHAELHGTQIKVETRGDHPNIGFWDKPEEWASWPVRISKPGKYTVRLNLAGISPSGISVDLAGESISVTTPSTGDWSNFQTVDAGRIEIRKPGNYTVAVKPAGSASWKAVNLAFVELARSD